MNKKLPILSFFVTIMSAGGVAQGIIDVHCHSITPQYMEVLERHNATLDETFPLPQWSEVRHTAFMDSAGIGCSVLTMPAPQPYFGDNEECRRTVRAYNEHCARLKRESGGRFRFCAALPLPDVEAAIKEAVYALDTLHADGVKLATNSRGQYLGDAELDTLMAVLSQREAVIIIHPHKPVPVNNGIISTAPLAVYEYPAETTRAVMNMMARNVLVRYGGVKVVVPHCGSFLLLAVPRAKAVHPAMLAKGLMGQIGWQGNLARLYYDLAGCASVEQIRTLLTITTPDHILYGSDYPYQPAAALVKNLRKLEDALSAAPDLAPYKDMMLGGNARRLFHIK